MAFDTTIVAFLAGLVQFIVGLFLAMFSVYIGLKMFDKLTKGINEWDEIKKGNIAVGIVMAAVILSIATVIQSGVMHITGSIGGGQSVGVMMIGLVVGIVNLIIGLIAAIIAIYIAIRVLDKITKEIDEFKEIAKGNVAVAIIMAGVLISVSFVIAAAVSGFSNALDAGQIASALGIK
ncbi:MAG: DUF350 domain-containing protein [Methanomassiliicoccales archaeon]